MKNTEMKVREKKRLMRDAARMGKPEPISRDDTAEAKKTILLLIDEKVKNTFLDNERDALRRQRDRIAKMFGIEE